MVPSRQQNRILQTPVLQAAKPATERIMGYDIARGLAFIGMVVVNFKTVMGASKAGADWLVWLAGLLEGRAAATFVVLAGVGISLLSQRARLEKNRKKIAQIRKILFKRAAFLFVFGLLFTPTWPPDILHFYGIYIAIGALLLSISDRNLWAIIFGVILVFVMLNLVLDYEQGWNFETLEYLDFWTAAGMIRHLFFNGFHPVFPWVSFLLIGMWLGRQDVHNRAWRRRILFFGFSIASLTEVGSWLLVRTMSTAEGFDLALANALFGTEMIPPMPLYIIAGGATAVSLILLCVMATERMGRSAWLQPLSATGQLALTLYVAHVVIGLGLLDALGRLENQSLIFAVGSALTFSAAAVAFSTLWRRYFRRGPLELLMRQIA